MQEELSRTEEDLINAQQENTYLAERLQEMEDDAQAQQDEPISVEDSALADMEAALAEQRAADKPEPPVAITPGGESQPWYSGYAILIGGFAIALILLIIWGLRSWSAAKFAQEFAETEEEHTEAVQALDEETPAEGEAAADGRLGDGVHLERRLHDDRFRLRGVPETGDRRGQDALV